jgi:SAM-dependent methyltransferase
MTVVPLTDLTALARNRARVRSGDDPASVLFLHQAARDEIEDRLAMVNRQFTAPAIVTPFPEIWQDFLPGAKIVADTEVLALEVGAHDLVVHALALHWANDPVGQLIQCRRALRPDGLNLTAAFGGQTLHQLRSALAQAESTVTGGLSPRVAPMAEIRDLGALLQRAGFNLPVADSQPLTVDYASPLHLMQDLRAMGEGNALHTRLRHFSRRAVITEAARLYAETWATDGGRIPATFEMIFLTGWAPDESQPKPLRPGSAAHRLASALGTQETPLKD